MALALESGAAVLVLLLLLVEALVICFVLFFLYASKQEEKDCQHALENKHSKEQLREYYRVPKCDSYVYIRV